MMARAQDQEACEFGAVWNWPIDRPLVDKLLDAIQREISANIRPSLSSPDACSSADMVYLLLGWMRVYLGKFDVLTTERRDAIAAILAGAQDGHDRPDLDRSLSDVARRIAVPDLPTNGADLSLFSALSKTEDTFLQAFDPEPPQDLLSAFQGGRRTARDANERPARVIDDVALTSYLRRRFPAHPLACASNVRRLPGGMGKETILFSIDGVPSFNGDAIIRMDLEGLATGNRVVDEFPVLQYVHSIGIPVPQPLWSEPDESMLGMGFIVVRRVAGSTDTSGWMGDPRAAARFGKVLARTMAHIHAVTAEEMGRDTAGKSAVETTRSYIETMQAFYHSRSRAPNPRIEAGFAFLLARSPSDDGLPAALVHGDIGFHNLMMKDGDVTAVLDWDYSHVGDPAEDVNYCKPFVERILPWNDFLSEYHGHGGPHYTAEKDAYYSVWRDVRNAAACVVALGALFNTNTGSAKLAMAGLIYGPRFEIAMMEAIEAVGQRT